MDKEFCLLDEPWIKVLDKDNMIREVSLHTLFKNAHQYKKLAGETATQDVAILRVLLAITITVFYRYSADGTADNVLDYDEPEKVILERWADYWENGSFKWEIFYEYLEEYRERFYLFHPDTPFWQVANLEEGTKYGIVNLFGNIVESKTGQTKHHFHVSNGEFIENVSYAEIARWMIFFNAFSKVIKYKDGTIKNAEPGRLAEMGLVLIDEDNLYEILMMNLCALRGGEAWKEPKPIWEVSCTNQRGHEIVPPDNLPELYTIQSRRMCICREEKTGIECLVARGNYYSKKNDNVEPMTMLTYKDTDIVPLQHNSQISAWQEFISMFPILDKLKSGIVRWVEQIGDNYLDNKFVTFRLVGLKFKDKYKFVYGEQLDQSLSLSKEIIVSKNMSWRSLIYNQVEKCKKIEQKYFCFAKEIAKILYDPKEKNFKIHCNNIRDLMLINYHFKMDSAFRAWLISIDSDSKRNMKEKEWEDTSYRIAEAVIKEYIAGLPQNHSLLYAKAFGKIKRDMNLIYPKEYNKGGENYGD